jgi:hypothetical protein
LKDNSEVRFGDLTSIGTVVSSVVLNACLNSSSYFHGIFLRMHPLIPVLYRDAKGQPLLTSLCAPFLRWRVGDAFHADWS